MNLKQVDWKTVGKAVLKEYNKDDTPGYTEEQQAPREVGQFTGQGSPGLQKK